MIPRKHVIWIAIFAAVSLGGYLLVSSYTYRIGFPLDDAWIHQTYARNLVTLGEWSFVPGKPSAGSTGPLWSVLLAFGYAMGLGPYVWTYVLGWLVLLGLGLLGYVAVGIFTPERKRWRVWGAILLVLEWHLVWAAGSGMETLLFAFMVTLVLVWVVAGWGHWFLLGAMIGLCVWVRPDGVTLLAPVGVAIWLTWGERSQDWRMLTRLLAVIGLGFLLFFLPYLGFNRVLAGEWWPNTFFAKQAEYAVYRENFIGWRLLEQLGLPLAGVGAALLPGVGLSWWRAWKDRRWRILAGVAWWVGYAWLYAWRLPVTYQHGRYLMPAMPIFFIWGVAGMSLWVWPKPREMFRRVLTQAWVLIVGIVLAVFWVQGARAYGMDVAFIESEMVATAQWVALNTEKDALVAAHDIGALGYFGERDLLDLAGLVSPEVIPFIRDEKQLATYLDVEGADYLITLGGWYPQIEDREAVLFVTEGAFSPLQGGTNMVIYRWVPGQ
ncbi:MAG TPA: hypothetical protein VI451_14590 [Anaerolineales bacterium]|nr:hypothetical protein [Anaerolineales bacterium]